MPNTGKITEMRIRRILELRNLIRSELVDIAHSYADAMFGTIDFAQYRFDKQRSDASIAVWTKELNEISD